MSTITSDLAAQVACADVLDPALLGVSVRSVSPGAK